jgi:hypothetical protein
VPADEVGMERRLRILGGVLILFGVVILGVDIALQLDDGLARSIADTSTCNSEPCTVDQLRTMGLFAGPITFLVLGGFGLALLKARVSQAPGPGERAQAHPAPVADGDVTERLRSIDRLREQDGISAHEHAEQRRRILDSV